MKLSIGISPCPNDTFIFDAIFNQKIDTSPFEFSFHFHDVETLNIMAKENEFDIIKLSYANYFTVLESYIMLRSGGALGEGVGPLLIAKKNYDKESLNEVTVAIPGRNTTANFLLNYALPHLTKKKEYVFSAIENAVLNDEVDAGVIIHENRFTYEHKGLVKIIDLGEYWEQKTELPIPLGGIAIKRNFSNEIHHKINSIIQKSILYARDRYPILSEFITSHSQELSEDVMRKHIELYVNDYSLDPGVRGLLAVEKMAEASGNFSNNPLFIL